MSGILDSKSRILDTILTATGRDQAARGELDVKFATITDRQIFYSTGSNSVLDDLSSRIYFEAHSDDNDTIVYEIDNAGALQPFVSDDYVLYGGLPFDITQSQSTTTLGGAHGAVTFTSGAINLVSDNVISTSTKNFQRQMIVGSRNLSKYSNEEKFSIDNKKFTFTITPNSPIDPSVAGYQMDLDQLDAIYQDPKFGNFLNYQYLPPKTKATSGNLDGEPLAEYSKFNTDPIDTYEELQNYLEEKTYQEINFNKTSLSNNILSQIFMTHQTENTLEKLAIIDVGEFKVDGMTNPHLFFAGKLYRDSVGALVFVNIFTILME